MKLTMKDILEKYSDCDMISLTGGTYKCCITEKEYLDALNKIKNEKKKELKRFYDEHQSEFEDYPSFEELYREIEKECYEYNSDDNKEKYLEEVFDKKWYYELKNMFMSDKRIEKMRKDFFHCHFIIDEVGKTTKYGNGCPRLFREFYTEISMLIDRENDKNNFCFNIGSSPLKKVPRKIRDYCLKYEVSFTNSVTESCMLMINYYFPLNDAIKSYLLKFKTDFDLQELQDLTIYKNNKVKFYSCTHEIYNSLEK